MRRAAVSLATLSLLLLLLPVSRAQASSCPVSLDVRHGAGFGQAIATGGLARTPTAQALDVTITNLSDRELVSMDVVVQLRSGKSRIIPLVSEEDLGERLPLHFDMAVKADRKAAASWGVASTQAIAFVDIGRVTYRDGSSWSASKESACQFTPNPMMLVSLR
jgi:hypothetical protein